MMNRLKGNRCYLCGPMDKARDNGETWRQQIKLDLADLGIIWLDPTHKPTSMAVESVESRRRLADAKQAGDFDYVCEQMRVIRSVDLRLVDVSDFLVVHIDTTTFSFGTIEEISGANRQKKPIIVHVEQGKAETPNWLLGMLPHSMIFSTWAELYGYLRTIAHEPIYDRLRRWQFFSFQETT